MRIEAKLQDKLGDSKVVCNVFQRRCVIPEGSAGFCMTGEKQKGILYSIAYGEVSSNSINPNVNLLGPGGCRTRSFGG